MLSNIDTNIQGKVYSYEQDIRGRAIVMVGGADGIGRAAAELLAAQAAPVFLAAHSTAELKSALAAIAQAGGSADGMVADLSSPAEARAFFEQAASWMGRVDAVVNFLPAANDQNICTQEALQCMHAGGQIINIRPAAGRRSSVGDISVQSIAAALRRQACDLGIHVTRIESDAANMDQDGDEIARCILASLAQPFHVDMIVLPGSAQVRPM